MKKHWQRWIVASVSKHFYDLLNADDFPFFIEGQWRNTRSEDEFFELRVDGPGIAEISNNYFRLYNEINILVQVAQNATDNHRIYRRIGEVHVAFTNIIVKKYGGGIDDDESVLGCMNLIVHAQGDKENINTAHFGKVNKSLPILQATVEGHYEMFLKP